MRDVPATFFSNFPLQRGLLRLEGMPNSKGSQLNDWCISQMRSGPQLENSLFQRYSQNRQRKYSPSKKENSPPVNANFRQAAGERVMHGSIWALSQVFQRADCDNDSRSGFIYEISGKAYVICTTKCNGGKYDGVT